MSGFFVKYFLKADFQKDWTEVSKEEWIKAERTAGFYPKVAFDDDPATICATGGFWGHGVAGRTEALVIPLGAWVVGNKITFGGPPRGEALFPGKTEP